jgi:cardiolipin synthase A/B
LTSVLRPRAGRRLPRRLRARHVGRLAAPLPGGVRDPGFFELLSRIDDGGVIHPGNRVELFCDGEEAVRAMLAALNEAREEVLIESYIFTADTTGRRFRQHLIDAAARGARVRVLADAWGSFRTPARFWRSMTEQGIEVLLFRRLFPYLWWQAFRDHRKLLVVDRRVAFTGGMNIANEYAYFSLRKKVDRDSMRDTHLRVEGPAAWEMAAVFAEGWEHTGGAPLPTSPRPEGTEGGAEVLVLESRPARGHRETAAILAAITAGAQETLWLTNSYFAPGRLAVGLLRRAAARGVDVRLLLPGRSDIELVRHAGHRWYSPLLRGGVRIFEYQTAVLHAKTLVADRYVSVVGSTNLDFRSFRFNAECNAVVVDTGLGEELAAAFLEDLEHSHESEAKEWRGRGLAHRAFDRLAGLLSPLL